MSGFDDQIAQFIDYNYEHSRILVSMKDGSNQTGKAILKALSDITEGDSQLVSISGPGLSKIQIADMVINGQKSSLLLAFAIIFVLLALIFRSVSAGVHASLPLVLSTLFLFGLMGIFNIPLDIVTTLLSSIMIGVGVDYTIHFLWRYKSEYALENNIDTAIEKTLKTTGRGIVFNAMSVIVGFSALIFSNFAPLRFFGVLVVTSIFSCLISALLLIPAIIKSINPTYLKK
jgi:predicted RND superfamily exporter protein